MKKIIIIACALSLLTFAAVAQTAPEPVVGEPNPNAIGVDSAQQKLKEVSIDKFEAAGFWKAYISTDEGYIQYRLFEGGPAAKANEPIPDEQAAGIDPKVADRFVLGVRTDFFRRGFNEIKVLAEKPIPVEGITKTVSVWVAGRNMNHVLKIIVQDAFSNQFELTMGKLNFQGWKKLTVAIPPQNLDGATGIIQRNLHYAGRMGIKIVGFKIECDPMEAFGTYYLYMDDLRAVSDLFAEDYRDADDMADSW